MEKAENEHRIPNCLIKGPGPKYTLGTLTGYINHDPSLRKCPAYTIRGKNPEIIKFKTPGPIYSTIKMTNRGSLRSPAYTIGTKFVEKIKNTGPSPADYEVNKVPLMNHQIKAPAYTMRIKPQDKLNVIGPGPNQFQLPTCIGPKVPDKKAQGAFTIPSACPEKIEYKSPGPAAYKQVKVELIKRSFPAYTIRWKQNLIQKDYVPGPWYDGKVNKFRRAPTYSFGIKHSLCTIISSTQDDEF